MSSSMPTYCDETEPQMDTGDVASINNADSVDDSAGMSNALDDLFSTSLDFLQWGDLFTWEIEVPGLESGALPMGSIESHDLTNHPSGPWSTGNTGDIHGHGGDAFPDGTAADLEGMAWPEVDWVVDAPALLKHFNEEVINQMGSLPINEKSGWRILNVPSAILTLSHITMFGVDKKDIRHASLANLYGLLAVSAFHLSLNPGAFPALSRPGDYWHFLSDRTYEAAKIHLKISLESETSRNSTSKAKYKEQLMAVGAVLASALLSGNEAESHKYLVEMERLIRVRGLTKPKLSRRARLFHNIYAWMRIVSESTKVLHDESQITLKPLKLASTGLNTPDDNDSGTSRSRQAGSLHNINPDSTLDSFLHLEQFQLQSDSESRGRRHDDTRDIHLVSSLNCREDMHMRIYGVPETWLRLVSQVTRLANVMDRLSPSQGKSDAETLASLQPKAAYLEEAVCSFKARYQSAAQTESNQSRPHIHMARALSAALVIFFYRRIRNIHPMMLQDSVNQVMDSLHMFDEALQKHGLVGPGTAWPAFIAGAEATGAEQRKSFEAWLSRANAKSGWKGYGVSKDVLKEVWRQRDAAGGVRGSPTWVDVCRQMRRWPLLC
ncbi:Arginine metabolism regulation protein II [Colletotrichum siamense]|nr:Arginine metabolism regulation protein II [Colletotrichum siamense]